MSADQEVDRISQAKSDIKAAIERKGVTVGDGRIDTYAQKIDQITGGGGYPEPTGTIEITENGEGIDVKDYASANVNVSGGGIEDESYLQIVDDDNSTAMGQNATYSSTPYSVMVVLPSGTSFPLQDDGNPYQSVDNLIDVTYANPIDLGDVASSSGKTIDIILNGVSCQVSAPCIAYGGSCDLSGGLALSAMYGFLDLDFSNYVEGESKTVKAYPGAYEYGAEYTSISGKLYHISASLRNQNLASIEGIKGGRCTVVNTRGLQTLSSSLNSTTDKGSIEYVSSPNDLVGFIYANRDWKISTLGDFYISVFIPSTHTLADFQQEFESKNSSISSGEIYILCSLSRQTGSGSTSIIKIAEPTAFATAIAQSKEDGYAVLTDGETPTYNFNVSTKSSNELHLSDFVDNSKLLTFEYTNDDEGIFDEPHTALLMTNDDLDLSSVDSVSNSMW